jgi:hypothetical protein
MYLNKKNKGDMRNVFVEGHECLKEWGGRTWRGVQLEWGELAQLPFQFSAFRGSRRGVKCCAVYGSFKKPSYIEPSVSFSFLETFRQFPRGAKGVLVVAGWGVCVCVCVIDCTMGRIDPSINRS